MQRIKSDNLRILLLGSGGREHALAWKIAQSPRVQELLCVPGNAGIAEHARCVELPLDDLDGLTRWIRAEKFDLVVVGPEAPLVAGIADLLGPSGIPVFGPSALAARLEGSKIFSKNLMRRHNIPTAAFRTFESRPHALEYLRGARFPLLVKADGLAQGKGVIVCPDYHVASRSIVELMEKMVFGQAGRRVVVEEHLEGEEASLLALVDGRTITVLEPCQDHKRVHTGDRGPNTGGMGSYCPTPVVSEQTLEEIIHLILVPVIHALRKKRAPFRGVLYAGLMITKTGPKVLEFNVRFGDPETQALLVRLKTDLVELILATVECRLEEVSLEWDPRPAVCVVMASKGYPGPCEKGLEIRGLEDIERSADLVVFHAGTARKEGKLITAGGRVLGVTALGSDLSEARQRAYEAVRKISFPGAHYRTDIALRPLCRAKPSSTERIPL